MILIRLIWLPLMILLGLFLLAVAVLLDLLRLKRAAAWIWQLLAKLD